MKPCEICNIPSMDVQLMRSPNKKLNINDESEMKYRCSSCYKKELRG